MNGLDLVIGLVLFAAVCLGFFQGLVRQLLSLGAIYVATVLAAQYHHIFGDWLTDVIPNANDVSRGTVAFVILFLVSLVVVNYFTYKAYNVTSIGHFGAVDHLAGAAIGLVIGWVTVLILLLVLNFALQTPWFVYEDVKNNLALVHEQSSLAPRFLAWAPVIAEAVQPWVPAGIPTIFTP